MRCFDTLPAALRPSLDPGIKFSLLPGVQVAITRHSEPLMSRLSRLCGGFIPMVRISNSFPDARQRDVLPDHYPQLAISHSPNTTRRPDLGRKVKVPGKSQAPEKSSPSRYIFPCRAPELMVAVSIFLSYNATGRDIDRRTESFTQEDPISRWYTTRRLLLLLRRKQGDERAPRDKTPTLLYPILI